jgi:hypothetical protein
MRGLTDEQRKALDTASAAALHCEAGGAEPPRDAVRVVDNVRAIRPDLLLHPLAGARGDARAYRGKVNRLRHDQVLHPMALGRGYMDRTPRGRGSEGDDRQGYGEGARVAAQRGHSIPEAPHTTQRLATGAWRDFHENKIARLPYVDPSTEQYARTAASPASRRRTRGGEQRKTEHSRTPLVGTQGVGGSAGGHMPFAAPPRPRSPGCGRAAGTPQRGRFAHALTQRAAETHIESTGCMPRRLGG